MTQKIKIILSGVLLLCILLFACKGRVERVVNHGIGLAVDSLLICKKGELRIISIGDRINPRQFSSQIYDTGNGVEYILRNGNNLYFFDFNDGSFLRYISINSSEEIGVGDLRNFSGFFYLSSDSIFVYNYSMRTIFLIDSASNVKNSWNLRGATRCSIAPEALTTSPIIYSQGNMLLSGIGFGNPCNVAKGCRPVSRLIDTRSGQVQYAMCLPLQYGRGYFGSRFFQIIYHTKSSKGVRGSVVFSFPADHYIYRFDLETHSIDTLFAGSRNIEVIESSRLIRGKGNQNREIEYYVKQPSYKNILYDKYRGLYHRIVQIPRFDWRVGDIGFQKPFTILTMDTNGRILSETPIFENYRELNLYSTHIVPEGIIIQRFNRNSENNIYFVLYRINE